MKKDTLWIKDKIMAILRYMMLLVKAICVFSNTCLDWLTKKILKVIMATCRFIKLQEKAILKYSNSYMKNLTTKIRKITEVGCQFIMLPVLAS
jgi:hypothetical protein